MNYKVLPGTETFKNLVLIRERIIEIKAHFIRIAEEFGAEGVSCRAAAGIPNGYRFKEKPHGWVSVGGRNSGYYMPSKKHPHFKRITDGPFVRHSDVFAIVGTFKPKCIVDKDGLRILEGPSALVWDEEEIIFQIHPETDMEPSSDRVEIIGSEYLEISARIHKRGEAKTQPSK